MRGVFHTDWEQPGGKQRKYKCFMQCFMLCFLVCCVARASGLLAEMIPMLCHVCWDESTLYGNYLSHSMSKVWETSIQFLPQNERTQTCIPITWMWHFLQKSFGSQLKLLSHMRGQTAGGLTLWSGKITWSLLQRPFQCLISDRTLQSVSQAPLDNT